MRSGFYLTPYVSTNNCNSSFFNNCRPDVIGNYLLGGTGVDSPRFSSAAFTYPFKTSPAQTPRFGNASLGFMESNPLRNWDMAFLKSQKIRERYRLEFRYEMFNALNHPNFGDPNSNADNPNFGRVFATQTDPHSMQFGLKLYW